MNDRFANDIPRTLYVALRKLGRQAYQSGDVARGVACTMACSGYPLALERMKLVLDEQQARQDNADGHLDEGQEGGEGG